MNSVSEIVLFTNSVSCVPCRQFKPTWEAAVSRHPNINFRVVDIVLDPDGMEQAERYNVMGTPTVLALGYDDEPIVLRSRTPIQFITEVRSVAGLS